MGFYGLGASKLGQLGPVIGWPIFVGLSLLFSNIWAIRTGEWENVNEAKKYLYIGILIIIVATIILGYSNTLS